MFRKFFIFVVLFFVVASAWANAGNDLNSLLDKTKSLQGDFKQVIQSNVGQLLQQSTGSFAILRPGHFRWQVNKPMRQISISNGSKVWMYEPELAQVTIRKISNNLAQTPLLLLSNQSLQLQDHYSITAFKRAGVMWYQLISLDKQALFKKILLGFSGSALKGMRLINNLDQTTIIDFSNVAFNSKLPKSLFAPSWPKNTDVVDMTQ